MKLLNSFGPNPRIVRMFLAEKGITLARQDFDLMAGENRKPPYTDQNPAGTTPALELDDGRVIGETIAICEYLEERHPTPVLVGGNAEARAEHRMWQRRVELNITELMFHGFRFAEGYELFKNRVHCVPEAAPGLKVGAQKWLAKLNGLMAGKPFVTGEDFRLVDIALYCTLDFVKDLGQPIPAELKNINAWFARVDGRPSAQSSLSPGWEQVKMRG